MNLIKVPVQFIIRMWYLLYPVVAGTLKFLSKKTGMERLGLFTPEQEKFLVTVLRTYIKPNNKFMGWIAKTGLLFLIRGIDNFGLDKLNYKWKTGLIPVIDSAMLGKVEQARQFTTDLLNSQIDIKGLDEEQELRLFDALTRLLALAIDFYLQKQNK